MAEKNNAKCSICGKDYYVCLSCKDAMSIHPWKAFCDTAPHYQVFQIVRGYNTNVYTKDEARTKLKNVNLEDMNSFRPHIKQIIKDILKDNESVVKAAEKVAPIIEVVEPVAEVTDDVENIVVDNVEEIVEVRKTEAVEDIIKPTMSRKKNYKVEIE